MKSINTFTNKIICGDCLEVMKQIPNSSVDCVITSPPYWKLLDYGWQGQWGSEPTYEQFLDNLWQMMDEIKRILKENGTVWINLGDTYGNSIKHSKCQLLLPHRFAIGSMERGWIIRNDIVWAIRNKTPESVKDRFAKKHEYIFFMVKNKNYYFDLDSIRDPHICADRKEKPDFHNHKNGKNPGDVSDFWNISKKQSKFKHGATFSSELITKPILAGCPKGGIILDPFCGSGTTLIRALELGRRFIGIEGKKEYCGMAEKRVEEVQKRSANFRKK